ncbi:MAG: hypothetical protein M3297_16505 [Thermoproteota archaeon]|nr:hypothetical protein [Thermoproteota archaeon]
MSSRLYQRDIMFLSQLSESQFQKVTTFIDIANNMIYEYFGTRTNFDIIICHGSWEMEVQIISRIHNLAAGQFYSTKSAAITDYRLKEIVLRCDVAKFGHYLHELIHGILGEKHSHQLKEGLAWYFTQVLTGTKVYLMPNLPVFVIDLYVAPVKKLAGILGDGFLKDFALGNANIHEEVFSRDIRDLFLPEEVFYAKKRYFR